LFIAVLRLFQIAFVLRVRYDHIDLHYRQTDKKKPSTEWCRIHKSQEVTNDRAWHNWSFRVKYNLTPTILINLNSLLYFRGLNLFLILWVLGTKISRRKLLLSLITVTAQSKAWVCDRLLSGICGFVSRRGNGYLSLVVVVCCLWRADHLSVLYVCDLETSTRRRRPTTTRAVEP